MEVAISVFAGIYDEDGKLLMRRRKKEEPSTPCPYEGDWELPGGTIEEKNIWSAKDERIIGEELVREVREETGLLIEVELMPIMHPAIYINQEKGTIDLAFMIPIGMVKEKPTVGENIYLTPSELRELAERPEGKRLVSGWGKRMCRMALMALCYSSNPQYKVEAKRMLLEVQDELSM
jgi:8-oxo-dGTP pyrophosphatase MutT (NUDIX family)